MNKISMKNYIVTIMRLLLSLSEKKRRETENCQQLEQKFFLHDFSSKDLSTTRSS